MQPGQLMLRVGWLGTYVQTQHDDLDTVVGQGLIPILHDQELFVTEARLALDMGLTERFAASLVVPVRVVSTSIVYRDGRGDVVELEQPSTHHRDETLTGIADPMLLGAVTHVLADTRFVLRAGVTFPLGRTEEDPFAGADMPHQHIQMGTGTLNPVVALEGSRAFGAWRAGVFAFTQQTVYENGKGYQAGDRYATGLSLRRALGGRWSVRGGPEMQAETAERWNGVRHTDEGNQGRIDVMFGAGASWQALANVTLDMAVKVPVYTHVVGGQLESPAIVEIGASWSLGSRFKKKDGEAPHEHAEGEHDHGADHAHDHAADDARARGHAHEQGAGEHAHVDEHGHGNQAGQGQGQGPGDAQAQAPRPQQVHGSDITGLDVTDLGKNGEQVSLVAVPGKITIFDFWAEWCEPCKTLEPALIEMARAHPERVAIRRVDVVDWDSPVAAQHLTPGGFGLPHLKVFDDSGKLVLEKSSAPGKLQALIDDVRAIVEAKGASTATAPAKAPPAPPKPVTPPTKPAAPIKPVVVTIEVSDRGFAPRDFTVPSGKPVVLRFKRTFAKTCATEVVFEHDGQRVLKDLPLDQAVDLSITFQKRGRIAYGCAMNKMIGGTIIVE